MCRSAGQRAKAADRAVSRAVPAGPPNCRDRHPRPCLRPLASGSLRSYAGPMKMAKIRLYVEHPLGRGQTIPLSRDQAHYLFGVMRQGVGDWVLLLKRAAALASHGHLGAPFAVGPIEE